MHGVILTFPGHFWQTQLCLLSVQNFYPEINRVTIIADDAQIGPWQQYIQDLGQQIGQRWHRSWQIISVSSLPQISRCVAGWWRQQLVKLSLDQILDDDQWFVVDGDVIFGSHCDIQHQVPISRRFDARSNWSQMSRNYVRDVLGISIGYLADGDQCLVTSPVPFRYLDGTLLRSLRDHVADRFDKDFLQIHLEWFDDQTIVADINPPDRWVMSEWELIECYRRYVLGQHFPYLDIGSGYMIDTDIKLLSGIQHLFTHSYKRDTEINKEWFGANGVTIDENIWARCQLWYDSVESLQRR